MPTYEYKCLECDKAFSLVLFISEHDKKCPECGSKSVKQLMSVFMNQLSIMY